MHSLTWRKTDWDDAGEEEGAVAAARSLDWARHDDGSRKQPLRWDERGQFSFQDLPEAFYGRMPR